MKPPIIIGAILVVAVIAGVVWYTGSQGNENTANTTTDRVESDGTIVKPDGTMIKPDGTTVAPDGTMTKPDGTMVKSDGTMVLPDGSMVGPDGQPVEETNTTNSSAANTNSASTSSTSATYVDYSDAAFATVRATGGKTVLYFHADWCPTCKVLEPSIRSNISELPNGLTILKVNYDTATALKSQYGVTYQHTFVQVDSDGKKLKLWSGSTDARDIADQLI